MYLLNFTQYQSMNGIQNPEVSVQVYRDAQKVCVKISILENVQKNGIDLEWTLDL